MHLFCFTYTYLEITTHSVDLAGDKNNYGLSQISLLSFSFSHACLLGHPVYFDHQDFLRFSSDFSFQLFNAGEML